MPQEGLGLFDTPADREEVRLGVAAVVVLFAALVLILPVANRQLIAVAPFVPTINSIIFASDLIIATLLYAQASLFGSRALVLLASGYVLTALLLVPYVLSFPGAFGVAGIIGGGLSTTGWLAIFRRMAFPLAVLLYAIFKRDADRATGEAGRPFPQTWVWVFATAALAAFLTLLAIRSDNWLPALFVDRLQANYPNLLVTIWMTIGFTVAAAIVISRDRRSVLDVWLLVALAAWLVQSFLNLSLRARFSVGWYGMFLMSLVSSLSVMLALLVESNRLYARLALANAARARERESRLMTADAVAAAIGHEVGQPLASISLNASVGLSSLTRERPDIGKAVEALREIVDSGQRSFEIIKSVRAIVKRGPEWAIEFSLNDLVRETVAVLDRELAGAKVNLELSLDDGIPPVVANRVQMQQVLVNLVTNAIESLTSTRTNRRISIRSMPADGKVLLEVSDSGAGIRPEEAWQVFEAFHTTKENGTGIGLSLCRTIVEEHGGQIWASPGENGGAVFHVQLPQMSLEQRDLATTH